MIFLMENGQLTIDNGQMTDENGQWAIYELRINVV